jgi:succinate dehydrogenase/fumarate reductase flavoprotein subunit
VAKPIAFKEEIIKADVLCIGGGIAGLMAAIRASELGAQVVVADKANTLASGAGGMGNDHFQCYIPEIHGKDMKLIIEGFRHSPMSGWWRDHKFVQTQIDRSFEMLKLWDSWGIPMKKDGNYEFAGHGIPGKPLMAAKYSGLNQKRVLTKEATKRGAKIMNRIMVFELLRDGAMIGAIGVDTRTERIIKFQVKSVFLGTGQCVRLYPGSTPGWMFNVANSPSTTGDGRAMAYRIGAELALLEIPLPWAGPKYINRCGKGTWIGMFKDQDGKPLSPFLTKPERNYGDSTADTYPTMFEDYAKQGKGPIYMDCGGISQEDYDYMMWGLSNEGNQALINHFKEKKIDVRKNPIEFTTYGKDPRGGVFYNEEGETSVKGLYAAGDEIGVGISNAATFGWIAGENAAKYAKKQQASDIEKDKTKIEGIVKTVIEIRNREDGINWHEANLAIQQIMQDYAGSMRSRPLLEAGLTNLRRLRSETVGMLMAKDQHELMHCLEVLNMFDVGELIFISALERKETRGTHIRSDYPFANPVMDKLLVVKKEKDKLITEWRDIDR